MSIKDTSKNQENDDHISIFRHFVIVCALFQLISCWQFNLFVAFCDLIRKQPKIKTIKNLELQ